LYYPSKKADRILTIKVRGETLEIWRDIYHYFRKKGWTADKVLYEALTALRRLTIDSRVY